MSTWPLDKDLPEPTMHPSMAPYKGQSKRTISAVRADRRQNWQVGVWREATGRSAPQSIDGPFLPPEQVGQLLMALGRKSLPSLKV